MGILRFLLALSVLASHLGPILGIDLIGGQLAVQTFFIISGFYMAMVLNEKYVGVNKSFMKFISSRLLRLYPLYMLVLLLSLITCFLIGLSDTNQGYPVFETYRTANTSVWTYLFLGFAHLGIIGQDIVMFLGIDPATGNLFFTDNFWNTSPPLYTFLFIQQAWSLSLELAFYFVAPFILRRKLNWVLWVIAGSFVLRLVIYYLLGLQHDPWTYRFFPTEIIFFMFGSLSYRIYSKMKKAIISPLPGRVLCIVISAYTLGYPFIPSPGQIIFQYGWKDLCYFGVVILSIPFLFTAFKKSKLDAWIGDLSYPIYISHLLIARICRLAPLEWVHSSLSIAIVTIVFSAVINKLVARPIERYRQKRLIPREKSVTKIADDLNLGAYLGPQNEILLKG